MNWTRTQDNLIITDNYIKQSVYGNATTQGEGIDLRQELHWILYGKNTYPTRVPKGHWVVYRRFSTQTSEFYSNRTHEGIGGPTYNYTDTLIRTRKVALKSNPLIPASAGLLINDPIIYYFEYTWIPKIGDEIFEIEWTDHKIQPVINSTLKFTDKYKIVAVTDYRLENGNIQYYKAQVSKDEVSY